MDELVRFVLNVLARIVADELTSWCPSFAARLIRGASKFLPPDEQGRYLEEWTAAVEDLPGKWSKLFFALDLYRAAFHMRTPHIQPLSVGSLRAKSVRLDRTFDDDEPTIPKYHLTVETNGLQYIVFSESLDNLNVFMQQFEFEGLQDADVKTISFVGIGKRGVVSLIIGDVEESLGSST